MGCGVVMTAGDKFVWATLVLSTIGSPTWFAEALLEFRQIKPKEVEKISVPFIG